jgi:hypothetical protein
MQCLLTAKFAGIVMRQLVILVSLGGLKDVTGDKTKNKSTV